MLKFVVVSLLCIFCVDSFVVKSSSLRLLRNSKTPTFQLKAEKLPDLSQKAFPTLPIENEFNCNYDFVVIGSGPGGEAAAVQAAKYGARVAIIEKKAAFGGPTGLTSKAVREATKRICAAIEQIGGDKRKQIKGLWRRKFPVLLTEAAVLQAKETRDRLLSNNVDLFIGEAAVVDSFSLPGGLNKNASIVKVTIISSIHIHIVYICCNTSIIQVSRPTGSVEIKAKYVCIATGSRPHKPTEYAPGIPLDFTSNRIVTATEMGTLMELPNAIAILGGGIISVSPYNAYIVCSDLR